MKKRIKLTDKELAIGMWVYICLYIKSYLFNATESKSIAILKKKWIEAHHLRSYLVHPEFYWEHDCYLCHKHWKDNCLSCPLEQCGTGSLYEGVTDYCLNKTHWTKALECAKRIISVMQEVKDEDN